ncbi:siphovirus Gp157 family protein [Listeria monocytogenes]|nr:siphovirus Gp157 family protein [Listeria monocytogenes]EIZ2472228.1 siphovirus Gp157 family protein [Listeria monocytogenes]EIZ2489842.1 siphovirus Gp157 family protein [Listeria monocytogenes]EIZ2589788.1 siphovirus Gp157 family protein [Listeria monocytogenes]NVR30114.1 siphovirus Gp157 family protein [Listeria monocytogenes]
MKLYELTESYQNVLDIAEQLEAETLKDTLDAITESIEVKAENTAKVIKTVNAEIEALDTEIKRMSSRKSTLKNNIESMKRYLKEELEKVGLDKVKGQHLTIRIQNNPQGVLVEDESKLGAYLVEQPKKLDRKAILADLKDGKEIDGAEIQQGRSLRIV